MHTLHQKRVMPCPLHSSAQHPHAKPALHHGSFQTSIQPHSQRTTRRMITRCASQQKEEQSDNVVVRGIVSALTEMLRLAGVGRDEYQRIQSAPQAVDSVPDTATLLQVLRSDFEDNAYFITGRLSAEIYAPDCYFADPTVKFRGVDTWRRNLQLLVPFLQQPSIELYSLEETAPTPQDGRPTLRATWRLVTYLRFPWTPCIDIRGGTDYELDAEGTRIVRHVEFWEVSGVEAIMQMFKPSGKTFG